MKELVNTQQQTFCKILLIGDSCVDRFHYGSCERMSPEAPVPVFKHISTETRNGMCLNVEDNINAFKFAEVTVITNSEKITKERFIDVVSGQHLLRADFGEEEKLKPFIPTVSIEEHVSEYDCVVFSDYNKGFICEDSAKKVLSVCKKLNIPVFVDSKKQDLSCFSGAYIKINEKEFLQIDKKSVNMDMLIVTKGKLGAMWREELYKTESVDVVDVSGAGDTFLAALIYGYFSYNRDIEKAISTANKCASLVVQKSGTYSLGEKDVEELCI